jgi:hypothetical protein
VTAVESVAAALDTRSPSKPPAVDDERVQRAVLVVVEERHSVPSGVEQVVLAWSPCPRDALQAGGGTDVLESKPWGRLRRPRGLVAAARKPQCSGREARRHLLDETASTPRRRSSSSRPDRTITSSSGAPSIVVWTWPQAEASADASCALAIARDASSKVFFASFVTIHESSSKMPCFSPSALW